MSDFSVTLPSKPRIVKEEDFSGSYEIDGLYPGYGHTLGNSLRRIILASLPGAAVTQVKIDGVSHEFSTIEGVREDVVTILLNLKKLRVRMATDEPQQMTLRITGPKTVHAKDIKVNGQVDILNEDLVLADITGKTTLDMEITVERGLGYVPKEELHKERVEIGAIALDAVFSPIRRVNYEVENMRVGDRTDYNRLRLFIETDGTLTARDALEQSIAIMIHQLKAIIGFKEDELPSEEVSAAEVEQEVTKDIPANPQPQDSEVLKTRIDELGLSARVAGALDESSIRTVGGLVRKHEEDILGIPGMGQKGLQEIKRALSNYGITLRT